MNTDDLASFLPDLKPKKSSGQSWGGNFMKEMCSFHRRISCGEKNKSVAGTITSQIDRRTSYMDKRLFDVISKLVLRKQIKYITSNLIVIFYTFCIHS